MVYAKEKTLPETIPEEEKPDFLENKYFKSS